MAAGFPGPRGGIMDYSTFLDKIQSLDFIEDRETADAAIKAVLGIYMSSIDEGRAHKLAENLPQPLTLENLRGQQRTKTQVTPEQYLQDQFSISRAQTRELIPTVFNVLLHEKLGMELEDLKTIAYMEGQA
jgi:uncharacterized protein (DUF2267 family)